MKKTALALTFALSSSLIAAPVAVAQSSLPNLSSGFSSNGRDPETPTQPSNPRPDEVSEGLDVNIVGDVLGPGISNQVGFLSGDLGTMVKVGVGEEFAIIFGDSFRGLTVGQGEWLSPVGVVAVKDPDGRIRILRPLNSGDRVEQLIKYRHNSDGLTLLPSDVININGTLYLHAMWNEGLGNVLREEIFKSTNNGQTWQPVQTIPANYLGGKGELVSWEQGPDGYIYMVSTSFLRKDDVYLTRFRPEDIGNYKVWEHLSFDGAEPVWGSEYEPALGTNVRAGEMNLRYIDGHWVLAMFNEQRLAIEVRISEDIARDWNAITPADVAVHGYGGWGDPQTPDNFSQLYGGYIVPGSTIANMDLVISQWNTSDDSRYMSTQFNVKGLDKFFGITQNNLRSRSFGPAQDNLGNQGVILVDETAGVDAAVQEQLALERIAEDSTELVIVPLDQ
nr:DUF4185 domain-containing protein [Corynebacterium doosanense]